MGEAKRKKVQRQEIDSKLEAIPFDRVADAVHRLAEAASEHFGSDCLLQCQVAKHLLERLGVSADIHVGYAAWRVGDGDGDVISHMPLPGMKIQDPRALPFHAWLVVGSYIFDVTTAGLATKASQLDALDGGKTQVDWAPPYLLLSFEQVSSYQEVAQKQAGLSYYERVPKIESLILSPENFKPIDDADLRKAQIIFANPGITVTGPNNWAT